MEIGGFQRVGERRIAGKDLMGTEFHFRLMEMLWNWIEVKVGWHCETIKCH